MRVVMSGTALLPILQETASLLGNEFEVEFLPDQPESDQQSRIFTEAEIVVGFVRHDGWPTPAALKMWQVAAAGYDRVSTDGFPTGSVLCNCYGHEIPIAEYVLQSILHWQRPLVDAFERMKHNDWYYHTPESFPDLREAYGKTIGILGFGRIGAEVARRAKAFGMTVLACNRTEIRTGAEVDEYFGLDRISEFVAELDFLSISLHLAPATADIIDADVLKNMKEDAVIINVGRAGLIDEQALFDALNAKRIRGAVLDPQYHYPTPENPNPRPTNLDFASLDNALLTSHMSGASDQLIDRRAQFVADNIFRLARGVKPDNIVWSAS